MGGILLGASLLFSYHIGYTEANVAYLSQESDYNCHNTPTQTAWVAHKNGELRCFLEKNEYPHRVIASALDVDTENIPVGWSFVESSSAGNSQ